MTWETTPYTTAFEWLWTIVAVAGFLVQLWLLRDSLRVRRIVQLDPKSNGRRGRMVRGHLRAARSFLFVHATFAYFGIRALTYPNVPLTWERGINIGLFILASLALVYVGVRDRADRIWIRNYPEPDRRASVDTKGDR